MKPSTRANLKQYAPWLLVLAGAALATAAYLQALHYPLISDDISYVFTNKGLASLRFTDLWLLLRRPCNVGFEFLPLRDLSYWIDMQLFGLAPAPYRLHNIIIYLLCLPLLYANTASLWRYFRPSDADSAPWAAATVTALFAIHPALIESVVWISGRKYILPDFFSLLAIWFAIKSRREDGLSSRYAAATLAAFVGVMFSKSSYVGVAPIIALLWLRFQLDLPAPQPRRSLLLWPAAIMLLAAFLLAVFIVNNQGFDTVPFYFGIEAIYRSLGILGGLTRIALTPGHRHFFYPVFEDPWFPAMIALGAIMLLASAWGGMAFLRKRSFPGFILLVFLLLCLPYLQIIPAKPPSMVADRYIALAIWPAIWLCVLFLWRVTPLIRTVTLFAIALLLSYQTVERPQDWHSFASLVVADMRDYPGYYMPALYTIINTQMHNGLYREASNTADRISSPDIRQAMLALIQADHALRVDSRILNKPSEAITLLRRLSQTLHHRPRQTQWNAPALFVWLKLQYILGNEWRDFATMFPDNALVRYDTGAYLFNQHKYVEAEQYLRSAVRSPSLPPSLRGATYMSLGVIYMRAERDADAETMLLSSLAQSPPDLQAYCLLENIYQRSGRLSEAKRMASNCPSRESWQTTVP